MKLNLIATIGLFSALVVSLFNQGTVLQPTATHQPVLVLPSHPVETEEDLTYPIPELGNCANFNQCWNYCEDPVNFNQCVEFAKKRGFHKDDPIHTVGNDFWQRTQTELGCNSQESCKAICEDLANFDKCDAFAKKLSLTGGYIDTPDKPEFLKIAKDVLGCDSLASCATVCDNLANTQKCTDFANQVGLLGGQVQEGPGGCSSEATCKSYCSDPANFAECSKFVPPAAGGFKGPGGCNSPESCRSYCEQNPNNCRSYAPGSSGNYVPVSCPAGEYFGPGGVCTSQEKSQEAGQCAQSGKYWNGTNCADQAPPGIYPGVANAYFQPRPEMGNCKTPGECYDYCKANPGKCGGFDPSGSRPSDTFTQNLYYTPGTEVKFEPKPEMGNCDSPASCYDYCKANPGKCGGFDPSGQKPSDTYHPGGYYTPAGTYPTPEYYTPQGVYYSPTGYYTPGSGYTSPYSYYTPGGGSPYPYYSPTYGTPNGYSYPSPSYYTPGYSYPTPSYGTPTYGTPTYGTPTYGTPSYGTPSYPTPSYGTPEYPTPSYATPPVQGVSTERNLFQIIWDFFFRR